MGKWPHVEIRTPAGMRTAIAPTVISASRATDLPAFHAEWFMSRIRAGFCVWKNPFNAAQSQHVSFENCRAIVFWSKNPAPLMKYLPELEARGLTSYFHFTLNDYQPENLEPGIPSLPERMDLFKKLSSCIGRHRVIWRFDPVIVGANISAEEILHRILCLAERLAPFTEKLVFSFLDISYRKTRNFLQKTNAGFRSPDDGEVKLFAQKLNASLDGSGLVLATCAEKRDLRPFGIVHNSCIDANLLRRLCPDCREFVAESPRTMRAEAGMLPYSVKSTQANRQKHIKDAGQRPLCACFPAKDIGAYNTCAHGCCYCYATRHKEAKLWFSQWHSSARESLAGD